ncbi:MAG: CHASE2 domain-containing protein [Synechococcales bacterium]|nr:CHASE2 domain-containing protein [Synechococcales bacterium]
MAREPKLVILKLDGDFEQQGFQVSLEISAEGQRPSVEEIGYLPPAPDLVALLQQWQQHYRQLGATTRITPKEIIYTGSVNRLEECRQSAQKLGDRLVHWFESPSFRAIELRLREALDVQDPIRVLVRSPQRQVGRIPWHLWEFIDRYHQSEVALSPAKAAQVQAPPRTPTGAVKILAILGNPGKINTTPDRQLLETLPQAAVTFLIEPQRQEVYDHLWHQPWDILFFAGHSQTEGDRGRIYLNPDDSLTLEELKYGLRRAVQQGLQLAIFNSCDGLGLAYELESLNLPQLIIMREPVPDQVAQQFLNYFLEVFSRGDSLYLSVRKARERLQGLEGDFPCASWLPVIYQNPTVTPPTWEALQGVSPQQITISPTVSSPLMLVGRTGWRSLRTALTIGLLSAGLVMGGRSLGWLQRWELQAFDSLMRLRPHQSLKDSRILVIAINQDDRDYQADQGMELQDSLADAALLKLLQKLVPHSPRAIGLDVLRDAFSPELDAYLQTFDRFIAICRMKNFYNDLSGVRSLEGVRPPESQLPIDQIGFTNVPLDPDRVLRRQTLGMESDAICPTHLSLNFQLALHYLQDEGIELIPPKAGKLQLGSTVFRQLTPRAGGYVLTAGDVGGFQILANYRLVNPQQVSLREILDGTLDENLPELVGDRLILIGVVDGEQDLHLTPYTSDQSTASTAGVLVQAQMTSHILSAVLDQRPQIRWWPEWLEWLWIAGWAVVGSALIFFVLSPRRQFAAVFGGIALLFTLCFSLFLYGWWIPLVPALLGLLLASGGVVVWSGHRPAEPLATSDSP